MCVCVCVACVRARVWYACVRVCVYVCVCVCVCVHWEGEEGDGSGNVWESSFSMTETTHHRKVTKPFWCNKFTYGGRTESAYYRVNTISFSAIVRRRRASIVVYL